MSQRDEQVILGTGILHAEEKEEGSGGSDSGRGKETGRDKKPEGKKDK